MCDCWYEGYQVGEVKPRGNFINHQSVPGAQRASGLVFLSGVLLPHLYLLLQNEGKNTWESSWPDVCLSGGMCPDQRDLWSEVSQSKNLPGPDNPGHHPPLHPRMAHYLLFLTRPNIIKSLVYPQYDDCEVLCDSRAVPHIWVSPGQMMGRPKTVRSSLHHHHHCQGSPSPNTTLIFQ